MIEFSEKETEFLKTLECARLATSHDDVPHVKPVSFVFVDGMIIISTDYKTRAYENIKLNSRAGVVIDVYKSGEHKAVCIQGKVKVIETGLEFKKLYDMFHQKFAWVRRDPWKENEAPFLKIVPNNKASWGLK
ncbi:MAG: pyridoxamine 5'-phosphate oxidase family protein [Nitrosopumilus sp.]|nr:MAG: pyridoxamine 5'-phosphate oxidase family protein [Nitrosopumilus sp.]